MYIYIYRYIYIQYIYIYIYICIYIYVLFVVSGWVVYIRVTWIPDQLYADGEPPVLCSGEGLHGPVGQLCERQVGQHHLHPRFLHVAGNLNHGRSECGWPQFQNMITGLLFMGSPAYMYTNMYAYIYVMVTSLPVVKLAVQYEIITILHVKFYSQLHN